MTTDHVIITDDGAIRIVRLNRPAKKNALTDQMYETLAESLENAAVSSSRLSHHSSATPS